MPSLSFFVDEHDLCLLLGRLNADPEIALIVPDDPLGPESEKPDQTPRHSPVFHVHRVRDGDLELENGTLPSAAVESGSSRGYPEGWRAQPVACACGAAAPDRGGYRTATPDRSGRRPICANFGSVGGMDWAARIWLWVPPVDSS